jgi:hypothetical protein
VLSQEWGLFIQTQQSFHVMDAIFSPADGAVFIFQYSSRLSQIELIMVRLIQ